MPSGEDKLIARFFKPLATHPGALALTDDAAIFAPPAGHDLVLTADAIAGGMHFFPDDPPDAIARKALRVNLSDLAAKGAKPLGFLLTLALPADIDDAWLEKFSSGLRADAEAFACPLFGGDTVRTPGPVSVSISAFGSVPHGTMVKRSGAKPGDRIIVTGTIGDAALGLASSQEADAAQELEARRRHARSSARPLSHAAAALGAGRCVAGSRLGGDGCVGRPCRRSRRNCAASPACRPRSTRRPSRCRRRRNTRWRRTRELIETILTGGDDYEIVCAMKPDAVPTFRARAAMADIAVTDIGAVVDGHARAALHWRGRSLSFARKSFSHF